jgi:hypothetical protein
MAQWNYRASIPVLERYIALPQLDAYQRLIGQVNLAAALVHEWVWDDAEPVLQGIREEAAGIGDRTLLANALELCAQRAIHLERWAEAKRCLEEGEAQLAGRGGLDVLFIEKWKTILKLRQSGAGPASHELELLSRLRRKAEAIRHWETVRDCDLVRASIMMDRELLMHVYFGTPFDSFRIRILRELDRPVDIPRGILWAPGRDCGKGAILDLFRGHWSTRKWAWGPGSTLYRIFSVLVSDFYRPFRVGLLFGQTYPGEHFNPASSPGRIHQTIRGLRLFFAENGLPLKVAWTGRGYRLTASTP